MIHTIRLLVLFSSVALLSGCLSADSRQEAAPKLFTLLDSSQTGVGFRNDLPYTDSLNCYLFRNFYNGGGVGIGDLNNDGLPDLFLCGNLSDNRLYRNLGHFRFEDVTADSGMGGGGWTAGVALADVNGDGWLDVYLCKSGPPGGDRRKNELFLNNGDAGKHGGIPSFTEQAAVWGLDYEGLSTHAAFFDYDRDGDLDCYLLNNSFRSIGGYDYRPGQREIPDPDGGNKLLRNDGGRFTDVTGQAGIYSSAIGFGLGVTIGDYDRDGWQDIFVSNDFFERDYLYRNNGDGSFSEVLTSAMPEISKGSMGADMADLNNDGYPEVFVTEMTPADNRRYKTKAAFDDWNTYQMMQETGYHRQFGRNVLQLNNGDGTFSEIGRQAGVWATDWSWGALLADFDNDGRTDIFVANGIGKDLLDQDYLNFYSDPGAVAGVLRDNPGKGISKLIDAIPSEPVPNCLFRNEGDLTFQNVAAAWGLDQPSFSNGSAYGDLDNDGDLDLVVNNVNMPAFLYRNECQDRHWLGLVLKGDGGNTAALGASVELRAGGQTFYRELAPMRGFESCVDPRLLIGLGQATTIESIRVRFPSGKVWTAANLAIDQYHTLQESDARMEAPVLMEPVPTDLMPVALPDIRHVEQPYSDFDKEPLLFRMFSAEGPKLAIADVNGDGRADCFVGGGAGQSGVLLLQMSSGRFRIARQPVFETDRACEDGAAVFFDADGDGDPDLYVGSGSNEFEPGAAGIQDRLYRNDGRGNFQRDPLAIPAGKPFATGCVAPADVDGDGDLDLFVGMRLVPGHYGQPPASLILLNDGTGRFQPALREYPALQQSGMVTGAVWADVDRDGDPDLLTVGDWEPVRLYRNEGGKLVLADPGPVPGNSSGWWNTIHAADLDGDGDMDFVLGNQGLNSRFTADVEHPLELHIGDFDGNGRDETILYQFNSEDTYPVALRNDMVKQMPFLKKRFLRYEDYAVQTLSTLFSAEERANVLVKKATILEHVFLLNRGDGAFDQAALPNAAQRFPVYAIASADVNGDGKTDLLLGGNHARCKPEVGVQLAGYGLLLAGDGKGGFRTVPASESGLRINDPIRDWAIVPVPGGIVVLAAVNNGPLKGYQISRLRVVQ